MVDALDFLAPCRMVLRLPTGDGSDLRELRQRGVPGVGLGACEDSAARLRAERIAAFVGDWRRLLEHRHKFDGAHIYSQGFALVPGCSALGAITSNGVDLRFGRM